MANMVDTVEATPVLIEDTENLMDGSGSNAEEGRVILSDAQKGDDGATVVAKTEIALESIFDDKEKKLVGSLSSVGNGPKNVSGDIVDGVLGRDVNINNGDVSYLKDEESESKDSDESGRCVEACKDGNGRWNGEKLEDGDHGFRVGDLVWGKVRSYPWWPGQVYDPRDASEFAVKHSQEGRLLVAFFGDGSCSWCLPLQLVPFVENFNLMSKDGSSKSIQNAVKKAVDEVGRLLESRLTCKCIPAEKKVHLARPVVANAGVKAGVVVPELDIDQLSLPEYETCDILTKVMNFAKGVSVDNALELGILRSLLSAFYNAKCGYPLGSYNEPVYIEGLEDNNENEVPLASNSGLSIEVPVHGPEDDNIYNGGKQRSVAELMQKKTDNQPKRKKSANGSSLKRHKSVDEIMEEGGRSGSQKRRLQADSEEKQKKIELDEGKVELENVTSPRERKKSKYLSPPYTNFSWKILNSSFKMKSESDKYITRSPSPVLELDEESYDEEELTDQQKMVGENAKKLSFSESDINMPVNELFREIEFSAVDHFYLRNNDSLDKVWGFISAFRSSTYVHGEDYQVYQKNIGIESEEDLVSDVSLIKEKIDIMLGMLEDFCSKISSEEKRKLKDEMRNLMEYVETASDKVRRVAENAIIFSE